MTHFRRITVDDLKGMAHRAVDCHMVDRANLTDAIVKEASAFGHALSSEHVRRVCEMAYHDAYERTWATPESGDRVVTFSPPEAEKVANAIRARMIQTHKDAKAHAPSKPRGGAEKTASAPVRAIPAARNAFAELVGSVRDNDEVGRLEARHTLKTASRGVEDAVRALEAAQGSVEGQEALAMRKLAGWVRQSLINGSNPRTVLGSCESFLKEAAAPANVMQSVLVDVAAFMLRQGVEFEKVADAPATVANPAHPMRQAVVRLAELRAEKLATALALQDLRAGRQCLHEEMRRDAYA